MKIVFISSSFFPAMGGVETHVKKISEELVAKGHQVTVITELTPKIKHSKKKNYQSIGKSDKWRSELKEIDKSTLFGTLSNGINVYYLDFGERGWFKKFRIWKRIVRIKGIMEQADVIHCHDVFVWYLPLRIIFFRKKVFTTFHGYETVFPPQKKAIIIRKISETLSYKTIAIGDYIVKWYRAKPDLILYGGVDALTPQKTNIHRPIKILFVGRLSEDTGGKMYLHALRNVEKNKYNFSFEIIGDGEMRKKFEELGTVNGFVEDVPSYIQKSDLILSSSYLSILDALSYGKPVFAVFENQLKKDYLMLSPFSNAITICSSPDDLTREIKHFIKNPQYYFKKTENARKWIRNNTWENVARKYIKLWEK